MGIDAKTDSNYTVLQNMKGQTLSNNAIETIQPSIKPESNKDLRQLTQMNDDVVTLFPQGHHNAESANDYGMPVPNLPVQHTLHYTSSEDGGFTS